MSEATPSVMVTGAGDSVGRVIAERYLAAGAHVHICDVRPDALEATLAANPAMGGTLCDVADRQAVDRLFADAEARQPPVDILVNCVGIGGPRGDLETLEDEAWLSTFAVNVHGLFHMMRRAIPAMKAARRGAIVNFSTGSTRTRLPARSAYVASKYAVEGLTLNAARELGPFGVRCNAILPGIIDNARMRAIMEQRARAEGIAVADIEADYLRYVSMRTKVSPGELADTVLYLCSDAASKITGELIAVSGNLEWEA
jgi:NAD(P)-dependent dehydrogenase (short-subunit alcohol dehydrogenase family)